MEEIKTFDKYFWIGLISFIVFVLTICFFPFVFTITPGIKDFTTTGQIGDTIGGIMGPFIAIAVGALTFLAFWVQFKANEQQKYYFKKQDTKNDIERLETRLFEMIKWHRDNVSELTYSTYSFSINAEGRKVAIEDEYLSRKVFKAIFDDFKLLSLETEVLFSDINLTIYNPTYLEKLKNNDLLTLRGIDLLIYAKIDLLYCILYFGLSIEGKNTLNRHFEGRYNLEFCNRLILLASTKPTKNSSAWKIWQSFNGEPIEEKLQILYGWEKIFKRGLKSPEYEDYYRCSIYNKIYSEATFTKYYGGHQFRLSHYFTHLYQIIIYIDKSILLSDNEKRDNVRLIRAQLSTYEQIIFFINSISILGRSWELESKHNSNKSNPYKLISKYKLIKNIPNDLIIDNVKVSSYYPGIIEY